MNSGVCVYTDMYMYMQCYQHRTLVDQLNHMMFIYFIGSRSTSMLYLEDGDCNGTI